MSERIYFGKLKEAIEPPNLIELQINSYDEFFQKDVDPSKRKNVGLQAVFKEFFPIFGFEEKSSLDFVSYELGEPKMSAIECQREGQTFSAPLYVTFRYKDDRATKEEKGLHGRNPAHDPAGNLRHQRRRARRRFTSFTVRPVSASRPAFTSMASFSMASASSRTAVRGSRCSSTRATSFTFTSIAASAVASSLQRPSCGRSAMPPTRTSSSCSTPSSDLKLSENLDEEEIATKVLIADIRDGEITVARAFEPLNVCDRPPAHHTRSQERQGCRHQGRRHHHQVPQEGPCSRRGRGSQGHLPQAPPWRSADRAERPWHAQAPVLRSEALRPRPRRTPQDQPEARPQGQRRRAHSHERRLHRRDEVSRRTCARVRG